MTKAAANEAFVAAFQRKHGLTADGWAGDKTFEALNGKPEAFDSAMFFNAVRGSLFGGRLSQGQVEGLEALLQCLKGLPLSYAAYALATAYHEVDKTMQPIAEYGKGRGKSYGKPGRNKGQIAYGRGYVQLTWDENYERLDKELGLRGRLIDNYELALDPKIAADVMRAGMVKGLFTGKSFSSYLPVIGAASLDGFIAARRIINGTDKASLIAGYAVKFQDALKAGGWK